MTLTAVLLTGGLSSRMGVDKATIQIDGEPLWTRQLRVLHELQPDSLWISARSRPNWCRAEATVILDEPPSRGPLSGLTSALRQSASTHLLALAVDLPRMTAAHLRILLAQAAPGQGIIPTIGNRFEPLCAIYPAEAANPAIAALDGADVSLRTYAQVLLQHGRARQFPLNDSDKWLYHNMNSPIDLQV